MLQVSSRWFRFRPAAFSWLTALGRRAYPMVAVPPLADVPPAPATAGAAPVEAVPSRARPALRVDAAAHLRYPLGEAPRPSLAFGADAYLAAFGQPSEHSAHVVSAADSTSCL